MQRAFRKIFSKRSSLALDLLAHRAGDESRARELACGGGFVDRGEQPGVEGNIRLGRAAGCSCGGRASGAVSSPSRLSA